MSSREFSENPNKEIKNIFKNLLPKRIINQFLNYCSISGEKKANQLTREETNEIFKSLSILKNKKINAAIVYKNQDIKDVTPFHLEQYKKEKEAFLSWIEDFEY